MNELDYGRAIMLMEVVTRCTTMNLHGSALMVCAQRELNEINDLAVENQQKYAAEQRAVEAEAAAARQAADNEDAIAQGRPVLKTEPEANSDSAPAIPRRA